MPAALERQEPTLEAGTPGLLARPVGAVFRALSVLRGGARSLHPQGVVFEATVDVDRPPAGIGGDVPLLGAHGSHGAVVRLSRGAGLPHRLPDVHGLAIRIPHAYGEGRHQDLLLATTLGGSLAHHVLFPSPNFFSARYSTILLYDVGGSLRVFEARAVTEPVAQSDPFDELLATAAHRDVRFELSLAAPLGRPRPFATVTLGRVVAESEAEPLRFNPWNAGGGIRPVGPFNGLRESAYRDSQRGWAADAR